MVGGAFRGGRDDAQARAGSVNRLRPLSERLPSGAVGAVVRDDHLVVVGQLEPREAGEQAACPRCVPPERDHDAHRGAIRLQAVGVTR